MLTVSVFRPRVLDGVYVPRGELIDDCLQRYMTNYRHTISAWLGLESADISLVVGEDRTTWWLENGPGLCVEVYGPETTLVWDGFVDSVEVQIGESEAVSGPLMDVVNRATVVYTPLDATAEPPAQSGQAETPTADNDESKLRYGIIEAVYSIGEALPNEAETVRDTILLDYARPPRNGNIGHARGEGRVTLRVSGWWAWLDRYVFNDTSSGTSTAGEKIIAALQADPNSIFFDTSYIDDSMLLVAARERDNRTALSVIKAIVARGGADYNRWLFGVMAGRRTVYCAAPIRATYQYHASAARIELYGAGQAVPPWLVQAGKWTFVADYIVGRVPAGNDYRSDPRYIFNERVTYTYPRTVEIEGVRMGKVDQILAEYGGGMA
jgi:hypothetical protein